MWGVGPLLLEIASGIPIQTLQKSKVVTLSNKTLLAQGFFMCEDEIRKKDFKLVKTKVQVLLKK